MRQWFRIEAKADEQVAELYIFGDIGKSFWDDDAVSAKQFMDSLKAIPDAVTRLRVHMNSLGGDVFDGVAIANALRDQVLSKKRIIEMNVDGIAASAASIVIMAGDPIRIGDNAMVMVHNPMTIAWGYAKDLRKTADALDNIGLAIVATYRWRSSLSDEALVALMEAETWMNADEAIANGFATEKVEGLKAAACLDPRTTARITIPEQYRARVEALLAKPEAPPAPPQPAAATDVIRLCNEAGLDLAFAQALIAQAPTLEAAQAGVATEKTARAAASARAAQIRTVCATAKLPELADAYVSGAMSLDAIRAQLTVLTAKFDRLEIDGSLGPDQGATPKARIDVSAVYADRNRLSK